MEFPTLVYRVPGPHRGPDNTTYAFVAATDEAHFDALTEAGWFASLPEAIDPPAVEEVAEPSDRELLEREAKRLGVGFNWKTSDEALAEKIQAASKDETE